MRLELYRDTILKVYINMYVYIIVRGLREPIYCFISYALFYAMNMKIR